MDPQDLEPFEIVAFDPTYQQDVRYVVEEVLCREFGVQDNLDGETDLKDVEESYALPDSRFVIAKVLELSGNEGYNAATDTYEDLVAIGVIDAAKVTRSALQNAASIAALFLTTEVVIVDKPEEGSAMPMGGGDMDF